MQLLKNFKDDQSHSLFQCFLKLFFLLFPPLQDSPTPLHLRVRAQSLRCFWLFATPWTVAHQGSRLPLTSPGDLPDPRIEPESPESPALVGGFFTTDATWEVLYRCLKPSRSALCSSTFKVHGSRALFFTLPPTSLQISLLLDIFPCLPSQILTTQKAARTLPKRWSGEEKDGCTTQWSGDSEGQRSLACYSPWVTESDTT